MGPTTPQSVHGSLHPGTDVAPSSEASRVARPLVPRSMPFNMAWEDPETGKSCTETLVSVIRTPTAKQQETLEIHRLSGGVPLSQIPAYRMDWIAHAARLRAQCPAISEAAYKRLLEDEPALYQTVDILVRHEQQFFRRGAAPSGATQSGKTVVSAPGLAE